VADSTFETILTNLREAVTRFVDPYRTPSQIPGAISKLLKELGIAPPDEAVKTKLKSAAADWVTIADQLSSLNLNLQPDKAMKEISDKGNIIKQGIDNIAKAGASAWDGLLGSAVAIKEAFPKRLVDYIIYEFLTQSHPKIGGVFLLFGVLRRVYTPAQNEAFLAAEIRVFDLKQLIRVFTEPHKAIPEALKWGTDDFIDRPIVDGLVLLGGLVPGTTKGADDQVFNKQTENLYVNRGNDLDNLRASALHRLSLQGVTLDFVGLHKIGVGVLVKNPIQLQTNLKLFDIPNDAILALSPGAGGDPLKVDLLTE
jgi:hypothetical protein